MPTSAAARTKLVQSVAHRLYSALMWAAQPLLRRKLYRRARTEPGYALHMAERFGYYDNETALARSCTDSPSPSPSTPAPLVWIHAVSLGETRAAALVLAALRQTLPKMRLLLTHSTATGRAEGEKLLQPGDIQAWLPWDTPQAVERFLRHFRPTLGLLMETEVWPNLVARCRAHAIPLVLANARLNARSFAKAQRLHGLARAAYGGLTAVWAQSASDAQRLRALGAPVQGIFGNVKFDVQPDPAQQAQGRAWRNQQTRPVVMLASTREGEEALWLAQYQRLQSTPTAPIPPVQWLIVPRHPQRVSQVQELLQSAGLNVVRRSTWTAQGPAPQPQSQSQSQPCVWLGDSLGEMALYYSLADVALLGGSFAPFGGQNLIEAAAYGCPVVLGPHTFNFAQAAQWACEAHAAQRVADMAEGIERACALAHDRQCWAAAHQHALDFAQAHRGAAQATAQASTDLVQVALKTHQNPAQQGLDFQSH